MKIILFCLVAFLLALNAVNGQPYAMNTTTIYHPFSACYATILQNPGLNWATFQSSEAPPSCPNSTIQYGGGPLPPSLVCAVSYIGDNSPTVPIVNTSPNNWKIVSTVDQLGGYSFTDNNFDTTNGLNNVSYYISGFPTQYFGNDMLYCYNDTAMQQYMNVPTGSCYGVPNDIYFETYCLYNNYVETIEQTVFLWNLTGTMNFYQYVGFTETALIPSRTYYKMGYSD